MWKAETTVRDNIVGWFVEESRSASTCEFPTDLHPELIDMLIKSGINSLYSHQIEAWHSIKAGEHSVIVTGTASGKSLAYNLPILDNLITDEETTALYLFPTKALTGDQYAGLSTIIPSHRGPREMTIPHIPIAVYDGDTPTAKRSKMRGSARILLSNPDMVHLAILPYHTSWERFFRGLRYVIVDEIHTYRGVFGSHFANVVRRLKRIAAHYGSQPIFVMTSATISNPQELANRLIEDDVKVISKDGSPRGERHFVLYNPPLIYPELGIRRSSAAESVRLAEDLLAYNVQSILFARTRRVVEILVKELHDRQPHQKKRIRGYRSGYLPHQRRAIEQELRSGEARLVAATNALELGIDIGSMEAIVMVGYPGTLAAARQQLGRSGRKSGSSLGVLVASSSPLDQFLIHHPEYLLERSPEKAFINPDNLLILLAHLKCAVYELPMRKGDVFGDVEIEVINALIDAIESVGELFQANDRYHWIASEYPASSFSLRSVSEGRVVLRVQNEEADYSIGEIDRQSAYWMVHPNAIYLHDGSTYLVTDLNLEEGVAFLQASNPDYFTEPRREVRIDLLAVSQSCEVMGGEIHWGEVMVTTQVIGYRRVMWYPREVISEEQLEMPEVQLHTTAFWFTVNQKAVEQLREQGYWSNDHNRYGSSWPSIRIAVLERDNHLCQSCGIPEGMRAHHVHHKIPFRQFQSSEMANRLENLVTLCASCHQQAESVVRMRSGLSGLGYAFHHIAPVFLMCDSGDLNVLTESQSGLTEGAPTVVLYEQIPAGIGLSEQLYHLYSEIISSALGLIERCECKDGCPACVGPAGDQGLGGKVDALELLKVLR